MTDAERLATIHALLLEEMADATDDTVKLAEYAVAALRENREHIATLQRQLEFHQRSRREIPAPFRSPVLFGVNGDVVPVQIGPAPADFGIMRSAEILQLEPAPVERDADGLEAIESVRASTWDLLLLADVRLRRRPEDPSLADTRPGPRLSWEEMETWTRDQHDAAGEWAAAVHLHASDNDVDIPEAPAFLARFL